MAALQKVFENPDVYCVAVPDGSYSTGATNCFIVESGGEFLVVDLGAQSLEGERAVREAFDEIGLDAASTRLFLTHLHADHAELVERIFDSSVPLFVGGPEIELSALSHDKEALRSFLGRLLSEGFSKADVEDAVDLGLGVASVDVSCRPVCRVEEGDDIVVGEHRFVVLDSSGHSPGHRSLHCPEAGLLICGDQVLPSMAPYISLYPGVEDRLGLFLERLEALSRLSLRCGLCGHGPAVIEDFEARACWTARHRRKRAEQLWSLVQERPGLSGAELSKSAQSSRGTFDWEGVDRVARLCVASNGLALLDRLRVLGMVRGEMGEDGVLRYFPAGRD